VGDVLAHTAGQHGDVRPRTATVEALHLDLLADARDVGVDQQRTHVLADVDGHAAGGQVRGKLVRHAGVPQAAGVWKPSCGTPRYGKWSR
jgi:hypothetical protein